MLGCGQDTTSYTVLCVLLMLSTLSFRFALPGKWPVCCIGSNGSYGVVRFATCLAGWINSFWLPLSYVTVFVVVVVIVIIVDVAVWVSVIGVSVFVSRIILNNFSLFSLFFQQVTLISIMPWFFTVVARWLGLSALTFVSCWLTVFICSSSGASKQFSSSSLSKCVTICLYVPFSKWA